MISLNNHDFQWGRSEVVIIYPEDMKVSQVMDPQSSSWWLSALSATQKPGLSLLKLQCSLQLLSHPIFHRLLCWRFSQGEHIWNPTEAQKKMCELQWRCLVDMCSLASESGCSMTKWDVFFPLNESFVDLPRLSSPNFTWFQWHFRNLNWSYTLHSF